MSELMTDPDKCISLLDLDVDSFGLGVLQCNLLCMIQWDFTNRLLVVEMVFITAV